MVIGWDSQSGGCGSKSQHFIQHGHDIFHIDLLQNCIGCLKRPKINNKEAGVGECKKCLNQSFFE